MKVVMKLTVGLMLLCTTQCVLGASDTSTTPEKSLRVAGHYLDASATAQALPELEKIVAEQPQADAVQEAKYRIAYCHAYEGRYEQSITVAREVVASNKGNALAAWAQILVGTNLAAQGNMKEAVQELLIVKDLSADLDDQSAAFEARMRIGALGIELGKGHNWTPARAIGLDENDQVNLAWALATVAGAQAAQSNFAKALKCYEELKTNYASYTDDIAWAAARIAEAAITSNDFKTAPEATKQQAKDMLLLPRTLTPNNKLLISRSEYFLARYLSDVEHKYADALALLTRTAADAQNTEFAPLVHFECAVALRGHNKHAEAADEFMIVNNNYPSSGYAATALYNAGMCYKKLNRLDEAKSTFKKVIDTKVEEDWHLLAEEQIARCVLLQGDKLAAASMLESVAGKWTDYQSRAAVTTTVDLSSAAAGKANKLMKDASSLRQAAQAR